MGTYLKAQCKTVPNIGHHTYHIHIHCEIGQWTARTSSSSSD